MPVVRVEHDVLARHHVVGGERERHAAGGRVAGERGDDEVVVGLDHLAHDVVDREQVPPRLGGGVIGRLDHVEVDAVGEEVGAAHQHDHARVARARVAVGVEQPAALVGAHRAVVEVEVQVADAGVLLVGDLAERARPGACSARHSARRARAAARARAAGSLKCPGRLRWRDPDRAVDGRAADRAVALGDDLAGHAAQRVLAVDAEQVELAPAMVSSTPGWPSAARMRRMTVAVESALQSIARSGWRISGRGRPITRGSP